MKEVVKKFGVFGKYLIDNTEDIRQFDDIETASNFLKNWQRHDMDEPNFKMIPAGSYSLGIDYNDPNYLTWKEKNPSWDWWSSSERWLKDYDYYFNYITEIYVLEEKK